MAFGDFLTNATAVGQGISMVAGWFGASSARRREQEKIGRLKGVVGAYQSQYMGAAGNIDEKYKTLGGFQYDANQITGAMDLLKEQGTRDQFDNMVGRSNMADVGGQQRNLMDQGIAQERQKRLLSNRASAFDLQQQAAGEFREVQMGLLGLREKAANAGFTAKRSSFDLQSYLNRGYI